MTTESKTKTGEGNALRVESLIEMLDRNVYQAKCDAKRAEQELWSACCDIESKMLSVKKSIINNMTINELGELQSRGPDFDRLCAKFRAAQETLKNAERMLAQAKGGK